VHKQLKPAYRKRGGAVADVLLHWGQIVPEWSTEAVPIKLYRGVLTLATSSASVAQQLELMQQQILDNCRDVLGPDMVVRLKFENAYFTPEKLQKAKAKTQEISAEMPEKSKGVTREDLRASLRSLGEITQTKKEK
jgi:hypothetical protein